MKVKEFYEKWEANNRRKYSGEVVTDFRIREILKCCRKFGLRKILDVGSGYGYYAKCLSSRGLDVVGGDISSANVEYAKLENPGPRYLVNNFEESVLAEKFDVIYAFDVIEHVFDYDKFVQNCYSMLNDGGMLFISTQNAYAPKKKINFFFNREWKLDLVSKHHVHFFGPFTLKKVLMDNGFGAVRLVGTGKLFWLGMGFSGNMLGIARK